MKKLLTGFLIVLCLAAEAQIQTPSASPAGSVSSTVGLTDIEIDYFRPRARGRKIFGPGEDALVPYGRIWRTGANSGTKITFSDDVTIEGTKVPKGEYLIFTWPGESEWTVSLYKDTSLGGNTGGYDKAKEAVNFKVKPRKLADKVETLTFAIGDIADDNKSARIELIWENTAVAFTVGVEYDDKVMQSIKASTQVNPGNYFQAAVYYLETGRDLKQALEWITIAADANPNAFWISYQKARIQKALGDKSGALTSAAASLEAAKKSNNRDYQKMNEELIASLKK